MSGYSGFGKLLMFLGLIFFILGMLFVFLGKIPWLGRLPGDIIIKKKNFTFYFPLATSLLISLLLSLLLWFLSRK